VALVERSGYSIHSVSLACWPSLGRGLMELRYVENTLENNKIFDAHGLLAADPSREGRLKYWDNDLCAKHPHTFDFAVTVSPIANPREIRSLTYYSLEVMERFSTQAGCSSVRSLPCSRYRLAL